MNSFRRFRDRRAPAPTPLRASGRQQSNLCVAAYGFPDSIFAAANSFSNSGQESAGAGFNTGRRSHSITVSVSIMRSCHPRICSPLMPKPFAVIFLSGFGIAPPRGFGLGVRPHISRSCSTVSVGGLFSSGSANCFVNCSAVTVGIFSSLGFGGGRTMGTRFVPHKLHVSTSF